MKVYSYSITVDQNTGEIGGKHIFTIGPNTNLNELLLCEFIPLKNHLNRFLAIVLSLMNALPPLYSEFMHERIKGMNEIHV